jgi:tRNA(adenine34) deaminase
LSSLEENESDNEVQNKEDEIEIVRDSSSEYNRNQNVEYEEKITSDRNQTQEIHLEKKGSGANRVEFDWRKKSEKKLAEVSIEQEESEKESSHRLFSSSEININHNAKNRETKSTSALRIDEGKREKFSEESNEVTRQSESKLKYDRLKETEQTKSSVDKASSSSDKQYKGREDYRVGAVQQQLSKASHIQESGSSDNYNIVEHGELSELVTKKTNLRRRSQQITEISDTLDANIESVVMSERRSSARIKNHKEASSSYQESEKQHSQMDSKTGESGSSDNYNRVEHGELSQQVTKKNNLRRRSQQITEISDTLDPNTESVVMSEGRSSARIKNHEEASSTFQKSEKQHTQMNSKTVRRLKSDKEPHIIITDAENLSKSGYYTGASSEEKPQTSSPISQLDSADKSQKFATHFFDEFVEKAKDEISTSEIQNKQTTQPSSRDSQPKEQDSRRSSRSSGAKGPSDEMWALNNPPLTIEEPPKTEAPADSKKVVVRRSGRSMWSMVSDIIRMRWGPRSETRSSPNRSTSSEAWFSGQEQEGGGQSQREASSDGDLLSSKGKSTSSTEETSAELLEDRLGTQITRPTAPIPTNEEISAESVQVSLGTQITRPTAPIPATEETSAESLQVRVGTQITRPKAPISATEETSTESLLVSLGTQITRPTASMTATEEGSAEPLKGSLGTQITRPSPAMRMRRSPPVTEEIVSAEIKEVSGTESKDEEVKRTKLQRSKQLPKDRFDEWEEAFVVENEQRKMDEMFMKEALLEAKKAGDMWEVPVGAVLVHHGKIIARGYNLVEELRDSTAHAEMNCIREASNVLQSWRLSETTLYVTLEPCPMCAGAILQARVESVVWGAPNKLLGADGSWIRLFPNGGEEGSETASAPVHPFHPNIKVRRGVLSSECANVMQEFFQFRRRKKEKKPEVEPPPTPPPSCLPISNNSSKLLTKMHHVFHSSFCL